MQTSDSLVVIRFQICIFDILNTACWCADIRLISCDSLSNLYLWHIKYSEDYRIEPGLSVVIRFQICIFDILNTAGGSRGLGRMRCDSLSNLYLWHIKYSTSSMNLKAVKVVIRFQICIFDILNTAFKNWYEQPFGLWFAFKFVSLTY